MNEMFQSQWGVWVATLIGRGLSPTIKRFSPREGCELQLDLLMGGKAKWMKCFSPREGCELQRILCGQIRRRGVSVPVRGVSCNVSDSLRHLLRSVFQSPWGVWVATKCVTCQIHYLLVSVPVRGVSCNLIAEARATVGAVSVPVRGVSCNDWKQIPI